MGKHIVQEHLKPESFKLVNDVIETTLHESLTPLVGQSAYTYDVNAGIHNIVADTASYTLNIRLPKANTLVSDADNIVHVLKISNAGNHYTGTGVNTNNIIVDIDNSEEFFENLDVFVIRPNHTVTFALYKTTVSSVTTYRWVVRDGGTFRHKYQTSTTGKLAANTALTWTRVAAGFPDLITMSGTNLTFNFDGQIKISSQSRINSQASTGAYVNVELIEKLNGGTIAGSNKSWALKLETNNFIQYSPEVITLAVHNGDTLTLSTGSNGWNGSDVELYNVNYNIDITV